jgi:hypothetical protein
MRTKTDKCLALSDNFPVTSLGCIFSMNSETFRTPPYIVYQNAVGKRGNVVSEKLT